MQGRVYLAEGARVIGDVSFGEDVSVWYNAVIRGDDSTIQIGSRTNIQDGAILHVDPGYPIVIGEDAVVGHGAILHGCTIGENTLIGMGAIILSGAKIGKNCVIGAGSLITGKQDIPDGSMVMGTPGKVIRGTTEAEMEETRESAKEYVEAARKSLQMREF